MENSPLQDDAVDTGDQAVGPESEAAPVGFRLSFVIPEFRFASANLNKLRRQVRAVMRKAMEETNQVEQDVPIGFRVHVQFDITKLPEHQQAAARVGRKLPPCRVTEVSGLFVEAANGIIMTDPTKVVQFLVTTGWGQTDAVQVSTWEVDLGRREGVQ